MKVYSRTVGLILLAFAIASPALAQKSACPPDLNNNGPFAKPLADCFAELLKRVDASETALKEAKNQGSLPVGTIIASHFRPAQFATVVGEIEGDAIAKRTWILSDGREVTGTKFAVLTGGKPIPDLRGMFLRGVPKTGTRQAGDLETDSTALPKSAFGGITSSDLPLTLPSAASPSNVDRYDAGGKNYPVITSGPKQVVPAHFHTVLVNGGGDDETRPVNIAVYYYIKIN